MFIQECISNTGTLKSSLQVLVTNTDLSTSNPNIYMSTTSTVYSNYANFRLLDIQTHTSNLIKLEEKISKITASAYALIWLEFILKDYDFRSINYIFENIEVEKLDEWSIVSLLRTAAFARENIPVWKKFVDRCVKSLIEKNKNPEKILIGIL